MNIIDSNECPVCSQSFEDVEYFICVECGNLICMDCCLESNHGKNQFECFINHINSEVCPICKEQEDEEDEV